MFASSNRYRFAYPQFTNTDLCLILNVMIMEATLNYSFNRKSENHFDWLLNTIKSVKYYEEDSYIVPLKDAS